ncbi:MAG TPA: ABC transporter ATP-binding protein [Erysipelothrix sp.]|nr:ABC transporter ATP-binding protein [Erysipelothrix sp.]
MTKFKIYIVLALVSSLIASICLIATPYYLGRAIDFMGVDLKLVVSTLLVGLALYGLNGIMMMVTHFTSQKAGIVYTEKLRNDLLARLEKVSIAYLDTTSHGYIISVFSTDSQLFQEGLVQLITQGFQGIFTVVIAAIFMFQIDVSLTLIVFISIPIMMLTSYFVNIRASKLFQVQQNLNAKLNDTVTQMLENEELIFTNAYEDYALDRFAQDNDALNKMAEKAQFMGALINPTTRLVNNISYMLIGLLGSFVIQRKGISIGVLTSFISYSLMFSKPLNELSSVFGDITLGRVAYQRILKLLAIPLQKDNDNELVMEGNTITMKDVYFSYNDSIPAIEGLNLNIQPLSKVAIVGPTGSGKSTLINLLLRFYDINSGELKIDGNDVSQISRASIRQLMGVVLQEPWLFKGSILDNLKYGNPEASLEDIRFICAEVGCLDYIEDLDQGFNAIVGQVNMSQGQKQMLTIVRALITQAPILLLDEATSNIDIVSEKLIQQTLTQIMKTHTSFFVAHRLQTVIDSDVILVMKEGRLVESGNHETLMAQKGFYEQLYKAQY